MCMGILLCVEYYTDLENYFVNTYDQCGEMYIDRWKISGYAIQLCTRKTWKWIHENIERFTGWFHFFYKVFHSTENFHSAEKYIRSNTECHMCFVCRLFNTGVTSGLEYQMSSSMSSCTCLCRGGSKWSPSSSSALTHAVEMPISTWS